MNIFVITLPDKRDFGKFSSYLAAVLITLWAFVWIRCFFIFMALRLWIGHYLYLHIRSSMLGMRSLRSRFSSLRDSQIEGFLLSSSLLLLLLLLLLLFCVTVWMDLPLGPPPMAARHEARHEFLLVEIIGAGGSAGLTVDANELCAWLCVVFLSWNLNIFKLNEYFESRAGTFIFEYLVLTVCSLKSLTSFHTPSSNSSYSRPEIHLFIYVHTLTHTHTWTFSYVCIYLHAGSHTDLKKTISFISHWRRTADKRLRLDLAQSVWPIARRRETCLNEISLSLR